MNLFYTVSTPDDDALSCARLARRSVMSALPGVDFIIVGKEEDREKYPADTQIFFTKQIENCWVGNIRYSSSIFELPYEIFTYIDSDILWFAKDFDFSQNMFCREAVDISSPWFSFGWDVPAPKGMQGANSGFFSMNKNTAQELSEFFVENVSKNPTQLVVDHIKLEQSTFNLYLFKKEYAGWGDKSDRFHFACDEDTKFSTSKNFHFNKYQSQMNKKQKMMKSFLEKNLL